MNDRGYARTLALIALPLAVCAGPAPAIAQTYPERAITLVIPYAAGGGTDAIARGVIAAVSKKIGQPFVYENRAGAATALGTQYVARAKPDGYTIMVGGPSNFSVVPALKPDTAGYDLFRDFDPIGLVYSASNVIVVRSDMPVNTLKEFVDYVRANPGKVNYGSSGIGSFQHLGMEVLKAEAGGLDMVHVPYKGLGEVIPAMLSGTVQAAMSSFEPVLGHIRSGTFKALAVTGTTRAGVVPDVPTGVESGYPNFVIDARVGFVAPKGTPPERVEFLRKAIADTLQTQEMRDFYARIGGRIIMPDRDEFIAFYKEDIPRFRTAGKAAGIYEGK